MEASTPALLSATLAKGSGGALCLIGVRVKPSRSGRGKIAPRSSAKLLKGTSKNRS